MQRIYFPNFDFSDSLSLENPDIYIQFIKVLRFQVGDTCIFFDGKTQSDFVYTLQEIQKKILVFSLLKKIPKQSEGEIQLELYQALPNKFEKLEYIIEKCSEVGFQKIVFFPSERSQKLSLTENKKQRLQKIMQEAIEQCGRNILCELEFQEKLHFSHIPTLSIVFHQEKTETSTYIRDVMIQKGQTVSIFVGPEGGFSQEEVEKFEKNNFQKVYLGGRILRCETVGAVTGFFLGQNQ